MKSQEKYLQDLKQWLSDTSDSPLEEMTDFFTKRLDGYEEHMSIWETSYQMFSEILPFDRDYFRYDFGCEKWDAVSSFESLHHFLPELWIIAEKYRNVCGIW